MRKGLLKKVDVVMLLKSHLFIQTLKNIILTRITQFIYYKHTRNGLLIAQNAVLKKLNGNQLQQLF